MVKIPFSDVLIDERFSFLGMDFVKLGKEDAWNIAEHRTDGFLEDMLVDAHMLPRVPVF